MSQSLIKRNKATMPGGCLASLVCLTLLLAACGGATGTPTTSSGSAFNAPGAPSGVQLGVHSASPKAKASSSSGQSYLIKNLNVTLSVKDTRKASSDLQAWISATDPRSTVGGVNYQQIDNNQYNVALSFSVEATLYPQIENYLFNYPAQHGGKVVNLNESVQDVSSDYVDSQSRLKNLHGEQDRLLTLLSRASVIGDVLAIEQRLTDVEGQIETLDAHLSDLNSQISFYTISITLQPSGSGAAAGSESWNIGNAWQGALSAAFVFGQALLTIVVWLAAFAMYLVPAALIFWFGRRWWLARQRGAGRVAPGRGQAAP